MNERNGSRNILQVGHWQLDKEPSGEDFKQHNNQQIRRDKGSNKWVFLSAAVAMEEWQMRFSDGLFGDDAFYSSIE